MSESESESPDVLVLREGAHGMSTETYAAELRERLPGREIVRARTPREEREFIGGAPVVTGHDIDGDLLERARAMELFACAAAGVGRLPLDEMAERGIAVTNASGVHGPNMAEHVVGVVIAFARRFGEAWRRHGRREWRHFQSVHELEGRTVTVVGLGAIGKATVERLAPFGVHTIGVRYTPEKGGPTDEVLGFADDDVHDALARSDYVVLACPLTDTTRGLIGAEELETMEPHAVLVNVGRGPVVETDALVDALRDNAIGGAALDVTDPEPLPENHPLWSFGNVLVTPHNSGHTPQYYARLAGILARNLETVDETGEYAGLENQVV